MEHDLVPPAAPPRATRRRIAERRIAPRLIGGALLASAAVSATALPAIAQTPPAAPAPAHAHASQLPPEQGWAYTRYELLAPGSGAFRIVYDVTATRPGARYFFNPIRKGSVSSDETVIDLATGRPLAFAIVHGADAKGPDFPDADPTYDYIRVTLARPVPTEGGGARLRILKTYTDARSYFTDGADLVFRRDLGITRNAVVLPKGYGLMSCTYPSQVAQEADGRLRISFLNDTPAEAPLELRAAPINLGPGSALSRPEERAAQSRDIVYFLEAPESHAFRLYHDYTETREGVDRYINVVRTGSAASDPRAFDLDTGEPLAARILKGPEIAAAGIVEEGLDPAAPGAEAVVFSFPRIAPGGSLRLRMWETYADPKSYRLEGDELVFDRTFGRSDNAVVLPAGWRLTSSLSPAVIRQLPDGRTRLDFLNPRDDEVEVRITAQKVK
ncbi:MAG: hypothetical protein KGL69_12775 [Alphaproteobacteria bacterium]|nr:hypothetical protein [Alphaproteobacteria bacterium]